VVALWSIFAVELAGLLVLGVQRGLADRRGGEAWVIRGLVPAIERAMEHGERRQQRDARLPLSEPESRQRLQNLALAASAMLALPGAAAVVASELATEWCLPAFMLTALLGADVAVVFAVILALWRGWLPLPGDDDDGDDDPELEPVPGGPWTRAHLFNLLR
jgi:hypothetical protein